MKKHFYLLQAFSDPGDGKDSAAPSSQDQDAPAADPGQDQGTGATDQDGQDAAPTPEDLKKYTDKELDELIKTEFARFRKDKAQAVKEAAEQARREALEAIEQEKEDLKRQIAELKGKSSKAELMTGARQIVNAAGLSISDDLLEMVIADTAEATESNVLSLCVMMQEAIKAGVKEKLRGRAPRAGSVVTMTKEQILSIRDRAARQKAIKNHMSLFK